MALLEESTCKINCLLFKVFAAVREKKKPFDN